MCSTPISALSTESFSWIYRQQMAQSIHSIRILLLKNIWSSYGKIYKSTSIMIFYQTLSWVDLKKFPNNMRHSYYQMDPTHQWKSLKVFSKSCLSNTGVTKNFFWEHTVAVSKWCLTLKDKYNNQLVGNNIRINLLRRSSKKNRGVHYSETLSHGSLTALRCYTQFSFCCEEWQSSNILKSDQTRKLETFLWSHITSITAPPWNCSS